MQESQKNNFKEIADKFQIYGDFINAYPFGSGHINGTYKVMVSQAGTIVPYVFQKINTEVFKQPEDLMENICRVIDHLKSKYMPISKNLTRRTMNLVPAKAGGYLYKDKIGQYWRVFLCIENVVTYDVLEDEGMAFQGARAFGSFIKHLADLPKPRLHDTIPDFHNTPKRYLNFERAIEEDVANRAADIQGDIEEYMSKKKYASMLVDLFYKGELPERVCHNDTKLNNVLIDSETGLGKCVIDLDTVMPGLAAYDFGDMIRTGTCFAAEDEKDTSKVVLNMGMFEAISKGYFDGADGFFTKTEKDTLVLGGIIITLEIGMRFLTDYLQNDIYFKIHRNGHNLDRARAQMALVKQLEMNYEKMCNIVEPL